MCRTAAGPEAVLGWLHGLTPAHWIVAAFVLGILEALLPGAVFLWFAIAAALVGVLAFLLPIDWQVQIVLFGVLSLGAIAVWRQLRRRRPERLPLPALNRRGRQYEGQICEVVDAITNGFGKAKVGDSVWTIHGPDLPVGARVRVVAIEGTVLQVVAVEDSAT